MTKIRLLLLSVISIMTVSVAALPSAGASNDDASNDDAHYTVTITNSTAAQYLTPPNYAAHTRDVRVFQNGRTASAAVAGVAENGDFPALATSLTAAVDNAGLGVSGLGAAGPIGPGGSATFTFTTDADKFSLVSMLVCTNDGFAGVDSINLPKHDGQTKSLQVQGYDAGTEVNTELKVDTVPAPFCNSANIGTGFSNPALAENGVIHRHRGIDGVGDVESSFDWNGPVASITITRG